jgi:branched-subunit amino acid aminotransferase/4-amino-4-deoxychorismate lyase
MSRVIRQLDFNEAVQRLQQARQPYHANYLAMYSSWLGGVTTDPGLMLVPVDDHLVHRGDGVFEAFKCVHGKVYALERHMDRLERSAEAIFLPLPIARSDLIQTILATIRIAGASECVIRVFVSRGPGGFSTNPYECPASQLYIMVTRLVPPPIEKYEQGVTLLSSRVPIKRAYFANIKSCNYLPNVLMKKEAEDAGVHYTVSVDEQGFLAEGSTENVGIITAGKEFLVPSFASVLRGTTVTRMMELARALLTEGALSRIAESHIGAEHAYGAAEMMMFGTTFDVLPVVSFDGRLIGDGKPGPFYRRFLTLLREDMKHCAEMLTPVVE